MSSRALIVVNYRSSELAWAAIRSARAASSQPLQVIVVDNSVDTGECEALRGACDLLLAPSRNLGYAGAINLARRSVDAELMIVINPDVVFFAHAIDALDLGVPVAGPALFWDDAQSWMLPPADRYTTGERLDAALASRVGAWARARDRRRVRQRVDFWSRREPARVGAISGAVMAIRTEAFDRAGGFDERFFLYFEETDFLRRAGEIWYVPAARCRHIYNQSAAGSPEAARHYAESERKYLEKWSGRAVTNAIKWIERPSAAAFEGSEGDIVLDRQDVLDDVMIEASPLPGFDTAAGCFPRSRRVDIAPEILAAYRGEALHLRVVERASGRVLATYVRRRMAP
jgi:N-acetylglucosaminyl-diphospho-decaprenol L-rhamnosyltransferase